LFSSGVLTEGLAIGSHKRSLGEFDVAAADPIVLVGVSSPYRDAIEAWPEIRDREVLRLGFCGLGVLSQSRVALCVVEVDAPHEEAYERLRALAKVLRGSPLVVLGRHLGADLGWESPMSSSFRHHRKTWRPACSPAVLETRQRLDLS
jgi:hypothetical protein